MSVSSVTCPPTPGSVRSAPWTEETDELGRGERGDPSADKLAVHAVPATPAQLPLRWPPPTPATPEGLPSRLLSFSSTAPLFLSQPFS